MYNIQFIGKQIRHYRRLRKMTQSEVANRLNVTYQAVSNWENAATVPDVQNLCRLAGLFRISVDALLRDSAPCAKIAVDGGGTKAEFCLFMADGKVRKRFKLAGTNASVSGLERVVEIFREGIDKCLGEGMPIDTVFIGNAGSKLDRIRQMLQDRYPQLNIYVESDGVNALCSGNGDAAMICGTGSILILKDGDGIRRVGGWGYMLGDSGSAFNFGRAVLRTVANREDGLPVGAIISRIFYERRNGATMRQVHYPREVSTIAFVAEVVFEAHEAGDPEAAQIIEEEMSQVGALITAACQPGDCVLLCGGMFEHFGKYLIPVLEKYTGKGITFRRPSLPPIYGACVRCCQLSDVICDTSFEENFSKSIKEDEK